jgi:hypothetical protein
LDLAISRNFCLSVEEAGIVIAPRSRDGGERLGPTFVTRTAVVTFDFLLFGGDAEAIAIGFVPFQPEHMTCVSFYRNDGMASGDGSRNSVSG